MNIFTSPVILESTKQNITFEISLLILIAGVMGYFFHYFLEKNVFKKNITKNDDCKCEMCSAKTNIKNVEKKENINNSKNTPEPILNKKDDLQIIEGIGPKSEEVLNKENIKTYADVAKMNPEDLRVILDKYGDKFAFLNTETWPKQAKLARDGKFKELEEYKDILIYGNELS